jgi:hypothetical protein
MGPEIDALPGEALGAISNGNFQCIAFLRSAILCMIRAETVE